MLGLVCYFLNFVYFSSDSPSIEVGEGWGGGHDDHECKFMFII